MQAFLEMFWSIHAMLSTPGLFQTSLSIRKGHTDACLRQENMCGSLCVWRRRGIPSYGPLLCSPKPCRVLRLFWVPRDAPLETWLCRQDSMIWFGGPVIYRAKSHLTRGHADVICVGRCWEILRKTWFRMIPHDSCFGWFLMPLMPRDMPWIAIISSQGFALAQWISESNGLGPDLPRSWIDAACVWAGAWGYNFWRHQQVQHDSCAEWSLNVQTAGIKMN